MPPSTSDLEALLARLAAGERPGSVQLTLLSDLGRPEVAFLRERWPALPVEARRSALERSLELAEDNVDLDFAGLVRVAVADDDSEVRRMAVLAGWENRSPALAEQYSELLRSDPAEAVRAAAAETLAGFVLDREVGRFDAAAGDALVERLKEAWEDPEESVDVRARALESLGPRSLPWVDTAISDAYYGDDPRMRLAAVRAMGASANERWLEFLEETATSEDPELRFQTANAIGLIGSEAGIEQVKDLLADEDIEVVIAAVGALGAIGGDEAIEVLQRLDEGEEGPIADAIEEAIEDARYHEDKDLLASRIGL
ncbi:MAG: HEAT repeat domain-containing protein [Dehalococcoidia bacterium]